MNFIEASVIALRYLLVPMMTITSNIMDYWVNLSAAQPLTNGGSDLVSSLAQICISIVETVAGFLAHTF